MFVLFFGLRLFRWTSALIGFVFGFFLLFFLAVFVTPTNPNAVWIGLGSGLGLGALLFVLLFLIQKLDVVVASIVTGAVGGIVLYNVALVYAGWPLLYYICMFAVAGAFVVLGLCFKERFVIFVTSFYGAFAICYGVVI